MTPRTSSTSTRTSSRHSHGTASRQAHPVAGSGAGELPNRDLGKERLSKLVRLADERGRDVGASARASFWARVSARVYDPFLWLGERRGLRARRRQLLAQARGLTVEIGSGTGLNLPQYPTQLNELALAEPDQGMRERLERRVRVLKRDASVIAATAERLPFADGTVDTVVSTLVLCTVDSPELALREIARVLAPDGQLLFIEHVRAGSRLRSFWQDRLAGPWRAFASGCRCNRRTLTLMAECGFELEVSEATWRGMPAIVKPLAYGRAKLVDGNRPRAIARPTNDKRRTV